MDTMTQARARFEERFPEFQNKARVFFAYYKPEAKDEAVANSLFLTWHHVHRLVQRGKANDRLMTNAFYFSCHQTRSGRMLRAVRHCHSREVFDQARMGRSAVVRGLDLDDYAAKKTAIPDRVAFRMDTRAWLDSLTENQRQRLQDLAAGHSPSECARRWNVSRPAVSICRRSLLKSFERFMAPRSKE